MSYTLIEGLAKKLAEWLAEIPRNTGWPVGRIIRQLLETASPQSGKQPFLLLAGQINASPNLSMRKGTHADQPYKISTR
jgi:hypothetical protein